MRSASANSICDSYLGCSRNQLIIIFFDVSPLPRPWEFHRINAELKDMAIILHALQINVLLLLVYDARFTYIRVSLDCFTWTH